MHGRIVHLKHKKLSQALEMFELRVLSMRMYTGEIPVCLFCSYPAGY